MFARTKPAIFGYGRLRVRIFIACLFSFVLLQCESATAAGRVVLVSSVPLQTLKTDSEAQKLTASVVSAINRVIGFQATLIDNTPNKAGATAFLFGGSGLSVAGIVAGTPPPGTDFENIAANPSSSSPDTVTVVGRNVTVTPIGISAAAPEKNLGPVEYIVQPTLVIDPTNEKNLTLYIFATRHDGGLTKSVRWESTTGAGYLNNMLAKVDLTALFDDKPPIDLGTVLVIPQNSQDVAYAARVQHRLAAAHIASFWRNDVSLSNTRAELSIACAQAGARTILAWGVETDKQNGRFGFTDYHANVSFDLINCLPMDYNPPSFNTGLKKTPITNVPGVIAALGAILQTATRMTIAPIANVLSGSSILAIFPAADDQQNQQIAVDAAISKNVDKLCGYLIRLQRGSLPSPSPMPTLAAPTVGTAEPPSTATPAPTCRDYNPSLPTASPSVSPLPVSVASPTATPTPTPTPAYFVVNDGHGSAIRIRIEDPALIEIANRIVATKTGGQHVAGRFVVGRVNYEQGWPVYLDPRTITFFEVNANEACNKSLNSIAEHLSAIGGSFLPDGLWCPWNSSLLKDQDPKAKTGNTPKNRRVNL